MGAGGRSSTLLPRAANSPLIYLVFIYQVACGAAQTGRIGAVAPGQLCFPSMTQTFKFEAVRKGNGSNLPGAAKAGCCLAWAILTLLFYSAAIHAVYISEWCLQAKHHRRAYLRSGKARGFFVAQVHLPRPSCWHVAHCNARSKPVGHKKSRHQMPGWALTLRCYSFLTDTQIPAQATYLCSA